MDAYGSMASQNLSSRWPLWLLQRPYWALAYISARNWTIRAIGDRSFWRASTIGLAVIGMAFLVRHRLATALTFVDRHAIWLALVGLLYSATTIARRKLSLSATHRESWISTTPRAVEDLRSAIVIKTLSWPVGLLLVFSAIVSAIASLGHIDSSITAHVLAFATCGTVLGTAIGWFTPLKYVTSMNHGSRYIPRSGSKSASDSTIRPTLHALSYWPIARAWTWANPSTVRWPLMWALLSVMAGSSAIVGLAVIAFWMLVFYMLALLLTTVQTMRDAAQWLSGTSIGYSTFVSRMCGRSLVHQIVGTLVIAITFKMSSPISVAETLFIVLPWLLFVLSAYSIGATYSFCLRRNAFIEVALSGLAIAICEAFHRGFSIPLSAIVTTWNVRKGISLRSSA